MEIIAIGLNHRNAPVEMRAKLAPLGADIQSALAALTRKARNQDSSLTEGAIISTCNRVEVYGVTDGCSDGIGQLVEFLSESSQVPVHELENYLDYYRGEEAVAHLFTVACGLDSLVVGENEILGQVRDAYELARDTKAGSPVVLKLFRRAVTVGKRARTDTAISRNPASVSSVAVGLAKKTFGDLSKCRALVIGSGEMGQQALRNLVLSGVSEVVISNRTRAHAEIIARQYNGRVADFDRLETALSEADIVISSTAAPHTVIHALQVEEAMSARSDRPLVIVDIAMPPDAEAEVGDVENVFLYNLDDLGMAVQGNLEKRQQEIPKVEALVAAEVGEFMNWFHSLDMVPTIVALRRHADQICQSELQKAMRRLGPIDDRQREIVQAMAKRLTNKLVHTPTVRLKERANEQHASQYSELLRDLFDLNSHECN